MWAVTGGKDPQQLYVTTGRETKILARPVDEQYRRIYYITSIPSRVGRSNARVAVGVGPMRPAGESRTIQDAVTGPR